MKLKMKYFKTFKAVNFLLKYIFESKKKQFLLQIRMDPNVAANWSFSRFTNDMEVSSYLNKAAFFLVDLASSNSQNVINSDKFLSIEESCLFLEQIVQLQISTA